MYNVIKKDEWKTNNWAFGETNEILIYPENSSYANRDFQVRISVANCSNEERSEFTYLPGVKRFIANMDGRMFLSHEGRYETEVNKYEIERFCGDWTTYSYGQYTDFNLMLKGVRGDLYYGEFDGDVSLRLQSGAFLTFIYLVEGECSIVDEYIVLQKNDLLASDSCRINISAKKAKIFYGYAKNWE